eukprot:TRINITY_DN4282_c0_g1_i1.p1 TRINITY_DN4282_c0_g1~~TRINITY_DN4282_c0_g1_i1.p1  ORF type:complete len:672 (-),score=98.57 TRINITY_DN4282_c0_g1_i1:335-2182(-)
MAKKVLTSLSAYDAAGENVNEADADAVEELMKKLFASSEKLLVNSISWQIRLRIGFDVALGMEFLHNVQPPILHRDLKSPNILLMSLSTNATVCAKITDFGLSSRMHVSEFKARHISEHVVANPTWLAPEILHEERYSLASDVYSFGVICWELVSRKHPFQEFFNKHSHEIEDAILSGKRPTIPDNLPSEYADLIQKSWDPEPDERPAFGDIVAFFCDTLFPTITPSFDPRTLLIGSPASSTSVIVSGLDVSSSKISNKKKKAKGTIEGKFLINLKLDSTIHYPLHIIQYQNFVFAGCSDGDIRVWNSEGGQFIWKTENDTSCQISSMLLIEEGQLWCGRQDNSLLVWTIRKNLFDDLDSSSTFSGNLGMLKKGSVFSSDNWLERWFVLNMRGRTLGYAKSQESAAMAKFIQLEEGSTLHLRKEFKKEFCFQIHTKTRDYFLCAKDKEEMKLWIKNILIALKGPPVLKIAKEIAVGSQIYSLALSRQLVWCSTARFIVKCYDIKNYACVKEISLVDYTTIPSTLNYIPLISTFESVWIAISNSILRFNSNTFELLSKPESSVNPNPIKHMCSYTIHLSTSKKYGHQMDHSPQWIFGIFRRANQRQYKWQAIKLTK